MYHPTKSDFITSVLWITVNGEKGSGKTFSFPHHINELQKCIKEFCAKVYLDIRTRAKESISINLYHLPALFLKNISLKDRAKDDKALISIFLWQN